MWGLNPDFMQIQKVISEMKEETIIFLHYGRTAVNIISIYFN